MSHRERRLFRQTWRARLLSAVIVAASLPSATTPAWSQTPEASTPVPPPADGTPSAGLAPMTDTETASLGCVLVAGGVGLATLTAGGVALIAAEAGVGAGATSTAVAVPVVVGTMAAGCNLGALAAPAFLWVKHQGHTLGSAAAALWSGGWTGGGP